MSRHSRLFAKATSWPALAATAALLVAFPAMHAVRAEDAPAPAPKIAEKVFSPEQRQAIEELIKGYFIAHPESFMEVQAAVEAHMEKVQDEKTRAAVADNAKDLFHRDDAAFAGNPKGDITVVEFFDYNCGYCRHSLPNVVKLLDDDKNVRIVFKDLPILAKGSEEAARVALAARLQGKYWEMHRALFESKGQANEAAALKLAEKLGLDMTKLKADMQSAAIKAELDHNKELAQKMGINGTPHFLIGDRSIAGAPENLVEALEKDIGELRKTGCKVC
jgi:protein-disulfide isomerase